MVTRVKVRPLVWLALLALVAIAPAVGVGAAGPTPDAVDRAFLEQVQTLPAPRLPADAPTWVAKRVPQQIIDDFESPGWPDFRTWVVVADLNGGEQYRWAPRDCQAASGLRSLWAVGGGSHGSALSCGSAYPDTSASSALLWLDLTALHSVARLALVFDIWADAAPNEGLFINYMAFDQLGNPTERRTVYSATGRLSTWTRGVRLDLTDLRDRLDPTWWFDGRGRHVLLEFFFVSLTGMPDGQGIFIDNLALESEDPTPIIVPPDTPTPPPAVERTVACAGGPDCGTLQVRAFVDTWCDGRYQGGIDSQVTSGPYVHVAAGTQQLGTTLSKTGRAYFRLPYKAGVSVTFEVPSGYEMCANSPNPAQLQARDFAPLGRASVDFRVVQQR